MCGPNRKNLPPHNNKMYEVAKKVYEIENKNGGSSDIAVIVLTFNTT